MIGDNWPEFMNYLDTDPDRAMAGFYDFTWQVFQRFPPRNLKRFHSQEEKEDAISEFILSCLNSNFRKLRLYTNKGQPMATWLVFIANRFFLDKLPGPASSKVRIVSLTNDRDDQPIDIPSPDPGPEGDLGEKEIIILVRSAIKKLSERCQTLLAFELDGATWKEVALLLGLGKGGNAQLSNDARFCRGRLAKVLRDSGVNIHDYL